MSAPRTRAEEARRIVGRLRESFGDLDNCTVSLVECSYPAIAAIPSGDDRVIHLSIEIRVHNPDAPSTL